MSGGVALPRALRTEQLPNRRASLGVWLSIPPAANDSVRPYTTQLAKTFNALYFLFNDPGGCWVWVGREKP